MKFYLESHRGTVDLLDAGDPLGRERADLGPMEVVDFLRSTQLLARSQISEQYFGLTLENIRKYLSPPKAYRLRYRGEYRGDLKYMKLQ